MDSSKVKSGFYFTKIIPYINRTNTHPQTVLLASKFQKTFFVLEIPWLSGNL